MCRCVPPSAASGTLGHVASRGHRSLSGSIVAPLLLPAPWEKLPKTARQPLDGSVGLSTWLNQSSVDGVGCDAIIRFAILSMGEHRVGDILMGLLCPVVAYVAVEGIAKDVSEHLADRARQIEAHVHPGGLLRATPSKPRSWALWRRV